MMSAVLAGFRGCIAESGLIDIKTAPLRGAGPGVSAQA